jgi:outer membrane protein TolC
MALEQRPHYRAARAADRAADAAHNSQQSDSLPSLGIGALHQPDDTEIFPGAANVTSVTFSLSFPIWNNGLREIEVSRARVARDVARTIREDLERVVRRDVTAAYDTYQTSRAAVRLAAVGVQVGRENYRMQEMRYRAGASTILDLLDAQVNLAEAEADLVEARYETRLALAQLEAMLGRRLFSNKDAP